LLNFPESALPRDYDWQIRDFIRIFWFDAYTFDLDAALGPPDWHCHYFVMVDKHVLMSTARAMWKMLEIDGQSYTVYGLGAVLTYPAFRKRGYGGQVVEAATNYIKAQPDADLAILWTDPTLESFYGRLGWETQQNIAVTFGSADNPQPSGFYMMLFLSERAKQLCASLNGGSIYFGEYTW
jgi:GNAT superfamily N-acetyltransferase